MSIPTKFQLPCSSSEISIPSMIRSLYMEPIPPELKLHIHFTKSPKRDNIYKLCLWMLEEHYCLL